MWWLGKPGMYAGHKKTNKRRKKKRRRRIKRREKETLPHSHVSLFMRNKKNINVDVFVSDTLHPYFIGFVWFFRPILHCIICALMFVVFKYYNHMWLLRCTTTASNILVAKSDWKKRPIYSNPYTYFGSRPLLEKDIFQSATIWYWHIVILLLRCNY